MFSLIRDLPITPSTPRRLRFVDDGRVGCPNTAPRDVSVERCLACPELTGTTTQDGEIRAIQCRPKVTSRIA